MHVTVHKKNTKYNLYNTQFTLSEHAITCTDRPFVSSEFSFLRISSTRDSLYMVANKHLWRMRC